VQVYEKPIPLWPTQLRPGWSATVYTPYETPQAPDEELPWQLTTHVKGWESLVVPAGRFNALRYHNLINFRFTNVSERVAAQRQEKYLVRARNWKMGGAGELGNVLLRCRGAISRG
jgi:hypothetical protein